MIMKYSFPTFGVRKMIKIGDSWLIKHNSIGVALWMLSSFFFDSYFYFLHTQKNTRRNDDIVKKCGRVMKRK